MTKPWEVEMMTKEHVELSAKEVMHLARTRADELLTRLGPRISSETLSRLPAEIKDVLLVFEENMPVLRGTPEDEVVSTSEAAKLLYVSHQHVVNLVESEILPVHHVSGQNWFLRKRDVLVYKVKKTGEAQAFFESQSEDSDPPGL
jgi:excisionase family DNA binding protein